MDAADRNLWTARLRREQFVELLDGRGLHLSRNDRLSVHRDSVGSEILGIWVGDNDRSLSPLPQMIVAKPSVLQDLFAWSASYLRGLGPLSAISRVFTTDQFDAALDRNPTREFWNVAGGATALVVCEILALGDRVKIEVACAARPNSTLSFSLMRAWSLGFSSRALEEVADGYRRLPRDIQRPPLRDLTSAIREVVTVLLGMDLETRPRPSRAQSWFEALRLGVSQYEVARDVFHQSTDLLSSSDVAQLKDATAEQRVQFFDVFAPLLIAQDPSESRIDAAFALAFAAFICRPGLEQQASLLAEHARLMPEAWLWLGALQAFSPLPDALSLGSGAGWRIGRELFRPESMWAPPVADVALSEIDVLSKAKSKVLQRLLDRQRLDVEIYPMIVTTIRGISAEASQQDEGMSAGRAAERDPAASKQLGVVEARLEESLRIVRGLRQDESGTSYRSPRRRR